MIQGLAMALAIALIGSAALPTVARAGDDPASTMVLTLGEMPACKADSFLDERLAIRVGLGVMYRSSKITSDTIDCIKTLWPRWSGGNPREATKENDNPTSAEYLSPALLALLKNDPRLFIAKIDGDQELLGQWLQTIDFDAYTWEQSGPCGYTADIARVRRLIVATKVERKFLRTKRRLAARFATLKCRMID